MDRFQPTSSLRKSYSSEPRRTLSFIDDDQSDLTTHFDKKSKSVHFADEEESIAEESVSSLNESVHSQKSRDVISWVPSEHLYSDDTFIHDETTTKQSSHDQVTTIPTVPSYGSSTFIELDSDETNTDTEQLYSYTDSFVSSEVFSTSQDRSDTTYKEWKDVTEIVKDIEDLEESEFVTRADSLELGDKGSDETEASETFDIEIAEAARQDFVSYALRHLRLKELQSPRSLMVDSITSHNVSDLPSSYPCPKETRIRSKEEKLFCRKMIQRCKQKSDKMMSALKPERCIHPLYTEAERQKDKKPLEFYGLNSTLIDRLKMSNLQHAMFKKSHQLDKDILESKSYVESNHENEAIVKEQFISQMCAHIRRENMDDIIQAHLIKMHPITKFAEFVRDLPKPDEDVREILYEYKRQLEQRMLNDVDDVT